MIVRIKGGMGNQMFQYVLLKMFESKYGIKDIKADFSFFTGGYGFFEDRLSLLDVHYEKATKEDMKRVCLLPHNQQIHTWKYKIPLFIEKTLNPKYFYEPNRAYIDPQKLLKYEILDGYWQSWQYLDSVQDIIRKDFNILYRCSDQTKQMAETISNGNGILLGVRKGDYTLSYQARKHFYQAGIDYYDKAVRYIAERVENPIFYVFSNDMKWVHDHLDLEGLNVVYREKEDQVSDIEEMQLMQACKHAIIPNSTFHYFGAFLSENKDKIIVRPPLFFGDGSPSDLFPPFWTTV